MGLFWPSKVSSAAGPLERLGRALHWLGTALGVLILAGFGWAALDNPHFDMTWVAPFAVLFSAPFFVGGRVLRYILAGE